MCISTQIWKGAATVDDSFEGDAVWVDDDDMPNPHNEHAAGAFTPLFATMWLGGGYAGTQGNKGE